MRVLWTDGATYILNKPAGLATQDIPLQLNRHLGRSASQPVWHPHRIDKFTQGLQLVTTSKAVCGALTRSGQERRWEKRYRAVACVPAHLRPSDAASASSGGKISLPSSPLLCEHDGSLLKSGWIESKIARRPMRPVAGEPQHPFIPNCMLFHALDLRGSQTAVEAEAAVAAARAVAMAPAWPRPSAASADTAGGAGRKQAGGAWSSTRFELLGMSTCGELALYELELLTGRTHQIRVHFAASGMPLIHDMYHTPSPAASTSHVRLRMCSFDKTKSKHEVLTARFPFFYCHALLM